MKLTGVEDRWCVDSTNMACLKDADAVAISMKFPSGAIVTLDVSQHCTRSCDQRLEVPSCFSVQSVATPRSGTSLTLRVFAWHHVSCALCNTPVHGSQGTLRVDNRNPLGISEQGTSVPIYSQTQADRYREAHRELFRHFLRTLKGTEPPVVTKEQFLWTIQVAAAAEQSWRNGSAVDLRNEAIDSAVIKTEIL
ncbi:inositol 2-dehydrogenase-like [Limosa lapponica baueri]|uniref:Inositol 2-dehydrogenase-like n=1 Tax=Limosa lapponica baueri TaxID=1758121 RepID=A0A2I0T6V3_LIMLA|nr:inositol 2-dehydrogenase-like [Limosa lapponica baueri]